MVSQPQPRSTSDREIVLTRLVDAPRELVFAAWTDPKQVVKWWGPNGFTTTVLEMNVVPGGKWRYIMHGPDGTDYDNRTVYEEVVRPERLVYQHGSDIDDDPARFHVTVTFEAVGNQTRVTNRMLFKTAQQCEATKSFGAVELGEQTMDRLNQYVESLAAK